MTGEHGGSIRQGAPRPGRAPGRDGSRHAPPEAGSAGGGALAGEAAERGVALGNRAVAGLVHEARRPRGGPGNVLPHLHHPDGDLPPAREARAILGGLAGRVRVRAGDRLGPAPVLARTSGVDVALAGHAPASTTQAGRLVLAHELAHVAQQRLGGLVPRARATSDAVLEQEADRTAAAAVAGRPARTLLPAPPGRAQHYEAWEHTDLGDSFGGDRVVVTTAEGVELTFGEMVALSGDFYRSPEALMNAPAAELRAITAVMAREREVVASTPPGTDPDLGDVNTAYELATSGPGSRASRHRHDELLGAEDGDGHGADEHGHGDHGRVVQGPYGPEHIADAGPGAVHGDASIEESFIGLADVNASHFSPENIRHNYLPKHRLALDLARSAWSERNRGVDPHPINAGAAPSARTGTAVGELPTEPGAPVASDTSAAGPPTAPARVDVRSDDPAERREAMAWVAEAFANHYLTDAFAGGHLVSGNVGRTASEEFYAANVVGVGFALSSCIASDYPLLPRGAARAILLAAMGMVAAKSGSLGLKIVHDQLNRSGVEVRNAKGTSWRTVGDARLASSEQTRAQAALAAKASRDSVQDVLATGGTERAEAALDHIPDVARLGDGPYRPIADFAEDPTVFHRHLATMLDHDPGRNQLYQLLHGYLGPMARLYLVEVPRQWADAWVVQPVEEAGERVRVAAGEAWTGATGIWDRSLAEVIAAKRSAERQLDAWGDELAEAVVGGWDEAREAGGGALGDVLDLVGGLGEGEGPGEVPASVVAGEQVVTPVLDQTYAHGGFMGAAPTFMADRHWSTIFARLMPEAHARASRATDHSALMAMLENNPVLAAYGTARHMAEVEGGEAHRADPSVTPPLALEWDVWLDPAGVRTLDDVRISHGGFATTVAQGAAADRPVGWSRPDVAGGPEPERWLELFGRAIAMHRGGSETEDDPAQAEEREAALRGVVAPTAIDAAVDRAVGFLQGEGSGLVVDVKSTYSTPQDVAAAVALIEERGMRVIGVGTFVHGQLTGLEAGIRRVKFFHGLEGLEAAAEQARRGGPSAPLQPGDDVMFNAGALLDSPYRLTLSEDHRLGLAQDHRVDERAVARLERLQHAFGLRIGLYVQETAVSPAAVDVIASLVNARPDLFTRGFAYGNVSGRAPGGVSGSGFGSQRWLDLLGR